MPVGSFYACSPKAFVPRSSGRESFRPQRAWGACHRKRSLEPDPGLDDQIVKGKEKDGHESDDGNGQVKAEPGFGTLGLFLAVSVGGVVVWLDRDEVVSAFFPAAEWFLALHHYSTCGAIIRFAS